MKSVWTAGTLAAALLAGCTATDPTGGGGGGGGGGGTITGCGAQSSTYCSGEVNRFRYDAVTDTISINNLPFDLSGNYTRQASLDRGSFRAYVNSAGFNTYVALYRQTANVSAGVVGTGDYLDYGYGGSIFGNNGTTSLPGTGQATYVGDYAGVRVYEGGGIGFSQGDMTLAIDFDDFDTTGAIDSYVNNRVAYNGSGVAIGALPDIAMTTTGFDTGNRIKQTTAVEVVPSGAGATGTMQGIFGGPGGTEIAGVIVLTGPDALSTDNVKETGAFVLLRNTYTP